MATTSIVQTLLEGGGVIGGLAPNMPQYTLESGAALIARESCQELHEIFEVAIVETNEAALGAYLEGSKDVMESATYGPVFEEAEKKAGGKVIEFLKALKNKVFAFFRNIADRIILAVNNYDKFYNKHKDALAKAQPLKDKECVNWNTNNINQIPKIISDAAKDMNTFASSICTEIKNMIGDSATAESNKDVVKTKSIGCVNGILNSIGVGAPANGQYDSTELHNKIRELFRGKDTVKTTVDAAYVKGVLEKTKASAKAVQVAQKQFNAMYDSSIKNIKAVTALMEKSERKGLVQHVHTAVSTLSKAQNIVNIYANAGFSSIIARASEAKKLTNALVSGKNSSGEEKKDN